MHIAIEGFDGVGKSTAAKKLAEKLGFLLVEKPLHFLFDDLILHLYSNFFLTKKMRTLSISFS